MVLKFQPITPWTQLSLIVLFILVAIYTYQGVFKRWKSLAQHPRIRAWVGSLTYLSSLGFALALLNPIQITLPNIQQGAVHVAVIVDVSGSTMRQEGWISHKPLIRRSLADGVNTLSVEYRQQGSASLLTVKGDVTSEMFPLDQLLFRFDQLTPARFAAGTGSQIGDSLDKAVENVRQSGGLGLIVLATDGYDSESNLLERAKIVQQAGIPIWIIPIGSTRPERGLSAVYLPNEADEGTPIILRGVVVNDSLDDVLLNFGMVKYQDEQDSEPLTSMVEIPLSSAGYAPIREDITFSGVGLRQLDVSITEVGMTAPTTRRLYTHVTRPLKILAVGGDFSWVATTVTREFAQIEQVTPQTFSAIEDLAAYDAVVINAVPASEFTPTDLSRLAEAVEVNGLGLMVVNGNHRLADPESPTVLHTFQNSPIGPLLPVSTLPRPFTPEPPPRQVVMLMDISGSMAGAPLTKEQQLTAYIIEELLRDVDTLDIILFDTAPIHLVESRKMDSAGKQFALSLLSKIGIGGGTDPETALALIKNRQFTECGLIFMSDGGFSDSGLARVRPDCQITAFEIGVSTPSSNGAINEIADPIAVPLDFDPATLQVPFFEHEERERFFEPELFSMLSTTELIGDTSVYVPEARLNGNAIAYLCDVSVPEEDIGCFGKKSRQTALTYAVRPKWRDPILAFGLSGGGMVGVFASAWDAPQLTVPNTDGRLPIETWLEHIVAYSARDRYLFDIRESGERLQINLSLKQQNGVLPDIPSMSVSLLWEGTQIPFTAMRDPNNPSSFLIEGILPARENSTLAILEVRESTEIRSDAGITSQRLQPQRIPILIGPPLFSASQQDESSTYGIDDLTLQTLALMTGGVYRPQEDIWFEQNQTLPRVIEAYWPILVVFSGISYLTAIAARRVYDVSR